MVIIDSRNYNKHYKFFHVYDIKNIHNIITYNKKYKTFYVGYEKNPLNILYIDELIKNIFKTKSKIKVIKNDI